MKAARKKANYRIRVERRLKRLFAYFRKAVVRLEHMPETPVAATDIEQAQYAYLDSIILACSYLDALAVFRCGQGRSGFIRLLQRYSHPEKQGWYNKISCLYLDQPPLDAAGKLQKPLTGVDLKRIRRMLYGSATPNARADLFLDKAVQRLESAGIPTDRNLLNRLSYAAYFYERYRCHGVHNVQPPAPGVSGDAEPHYEPRGRPELLIFPRRFILETLADCIDNLEADALGRLRDGPPPRTADDYRWLKETYRLKSTFIETVCAYYRPGPKPRVPATPRGSS